MKTQHNISDTMEQKEILKKLNKLYSEGNSIRYTYEESKLPGVSNPYSNKVNKQKFTEWKTDCIIFLENLLKKDDYHLITFKEEMDENLETNINKGLGILKSLIKLIETEQFDLKDEHVQNDNKEKLVENILNKFHIVAKQLTRRHDNRETIEMTDEYDVQDLLHSLLLIHFEDVRPEVWTPTYAGTSSRMDFLIPEINVIIEVKNASKTLKDKQIGDQLIVDIERYSVYPNCKTLYCFIYDKNEFIVHPIALENDLSGYKHGLCVKVLIRPKR